MPLTKKKRGIQVWLYSCLPSVLDGGGWSAQSPGHFTQWTEPQYPLQRRLDGPQAQSGRVRRKEIILPQPGFEPQTIQPIGSHYIDCAIPLLLIVIMTSILQEPTCCCKSSQTYELLHGSQGKCIPSKCYYLATKLFPRDSCFQSRC